MNEIVLSRFKTLELTPNGKREISSLSDVDNGFTANILNAFDGLTFSAPTREAKAMTEFLRRAKSDQISFGNYPDPGACLSAWRNSGSGQKQGAQQKPVNRLALPLINVSRDIGYSYYDGDHQRDEYDYGELVDDKEQIIAVTIMLPVQLNFRVWALAADRETLSYMTSAIGSWMRPWHTLGQTAFSCTSSLCGIAVEVDGWLDSPKAVDWSDISFAPQEERVYAAECQISVITQQLVAYMVDSRVIRHETVLRGDHGR